MPGAARRIAFGALLLPLVTGVSAARAQPASLVSFSWSFSGNTQAAATGACPCSGGQLLPESCFNNPGGPSFSQGGADMSGTQIAPSFGRSCGAQCNYAVGGVSGGAAGVNGELVIGAAFSSSSAVIWSFRNTFTVTGSASALDQACQRGEASCAGSAGDDFDLTFDVVEPARLVFTRTHSATRTGTIGSSRSIWTFVGPGGATIHAADLSGSTNGTGQSSDGQIDIIVQPGRYVMAIDSTATVAASVLAGNTASGSARSSFLCSLQFTRYLCPEITDQPDDRSVRRGGSVSISVGATGDQRTYRWRRNGQPLSDGPTGAGSTISGSASASLAIASVGPADAAPYDCVVTNRCGDVASAQAVLTICVGDFNGVGGYSVQDIFDFLAAYFSSDPAADVNASGSLTVQDIFDFLAAYFGAC